MPCIPFWRRRANTCWHSCWLTLPDSDQSLEQEQYQIPSKSNLIQTTHEKVRLPKLPIVCPDLLIFVFAHCRLLEKKSKRKHMMQLPRAAHYPLLLSHQVFSVSVSDRRAARRPFHHGAVHFASGQAMADRAVVPAITPTDLLGREDDLRCGAPEWGPHERTRVNASIWIGTMERSAADPWVFDGEGRPKENQCERHLFLLLLRWPHQYATGQRGLEI